MKKKAISLLLILAMIAAFVPFYSIDLPKVSAASESSDFRIKNGVLEKYNGSGGDVVIPDTITAINNYAFYKCENLTSVTIPNSVTYIGNYAFGYCYNLKSVNIPNSVTAIGERVFYKCENLISITISDSVTSIGEYAFYGCNNLKSVTISNSLKAIDIGTFRECSNLASVTIPNSVTSIGKEAFNNCSSLTSVTIGNSVTSIGEEAFNNCSNLKSLNIPDSVTSIGASAFNGCSSVTSVTIPNSVIEIDWRTFYNCTSLKSVTIPDSVTSIGAYAFCNCGSLTSVTIGNSVTSIGASAFGSCGSLTSVTIGNSVTSIGASAFSSCISLKSVTIPDSVTSIGASAFRNCISLTSAKIGKFVTSIDMSTFSNCSSLTSITIPDFVTSVGREAFYNCTSLTSATIGNSVESIGMSAFRGCSDLESVTIGNSVESIGMSAFSNCTSLKSVTIPNSVTSIDTYAFRGCSSLISVKIPNSVNHLAQQAFYLCSSLTNVTIPNSITCIDSSTFGWCTSLIEVTIPKSVTTIRQDAFYNCKNLKTITISNSVTSIEACAFQYCDVLRDIYYTGTPEEWKKIEIGSYNGGLNSYYTTIHYNSIIKTELEITTQPANATAKNGGTVSFKVVAQGDELTYQWQLSDDAGKTWRNSSTKTATYSATLSSTNDGRYVRCIITDKYGSSVTSNSASMKLTSLKITTQPSTYKAQIGGTVSFKIAASGEGVTYLWQFSDDAGKTWRDSSVKTATYSTTLTEANNGRYVRCVVTDKYGNSIKSNTAIMKTSNLKITTQPASIVAKNNAWITFKVAAAGDELTYQWQLSDDAGKTWRNSSTKTATYSATLSSTNNGRYVRCIVTDKYGNKVTSNSASMKITSLKITTQPSTYKAQIGGTVSFKVAASGEGVTYQWQLSDDAGKTWRNSSVKTANYSATLTEANNGRYVRCVVTDKYGNSIKSNAAIMKTANLKITTQPSNATAKSGGTVSFKVAASGEGLTYQWQLSDDAGKTWRNSSVKTANYSTTLSSTNNGRYVRCVVTDKYGNKVTSNAASMKIASASLKITTQPTNATAKSGGTVSFKVAASGEGLTYQWQLSDDAGKTWRNSSVKTANYSTTLSSTNNGRYVRCVVTDKYGNKVTSNAASMKIASASSSLKITTQPTNATAKSGGTVSFKVAASGEGLTYQWQLSDDAGKTWRNSSVKTANYSTTLSSTNNGRYVRCIVTDKYCNKVTSNAVSMKIK